MEANIYEVKNVKTFKGMEGDGFNASLYRNGKKVAFVIDSANGGEYNFQWVDWKSPRADINITDYKGEPHTFKGSPEEKILYEHIETLPLEKSEYSPDGMKADTDTFVSDLVSKYVSEGWMKRQLKKKYLFQIGKEIGGESYQTFKKTSSMTKAKVIEHIEKNYPNQKYKLLGD